MTKKHTSEEIKYRLSDLGVQIGNIAIEYISKLEKQNKELREQLEQAKEIIKEYVNFPTSNDELWELHEKAEKFIKE